MSNAKLTLIPAGEIGARIAEFAKAEKAHVVGVHVLAVSALAIAARDGQISPINRLASLLQPAVAVALKAFVFENCREWMTMEAGEYRVKPDSMERRKLFAENETEGLLEGNFQAERDDDREAKEREPWSIGNMVKGIERLVAKAEREMDERDDLDIPPTVLDALKRSAEQLKKQSKRAARHGLRIVSSEQPAHH